MGSMNMPGDGGIRKNETYPTMNAQLHILHSFGERNSHESSTAHVLLIQPVFTALGDDTSEVGGVITALFGLDFLLVELLPEGIRGFYLVVENTCGDSFTYILDGNNATLKG